MSKRYFGFQIEHEIQKQFVMAVCLPDQDTNNFIYKQQSYLDGFEFTLTHKTKKNVNLEGGCFFSNQKNNYVHVDILAFLEEPDIDKLVEFIKNDFFISRKKSVDHIKKILAEIK